MSEQQSAMSGQLSTVGVRRSAVRDQRSAGRGFTLIELMVVIAIIAILVVVIGYASRGFMADAKVKETKAIMNTIDAAMADYKAASGRDMPDPSLKQETATVYSPWPPVDPAGNRNDFYRRSGSLTEPAAVGDPVYAAADNGNPTTSPPVPPTPTGKKVYGIQAMYYALVSEPSSKAILNKVSTKYWARASALWPESDDFLTVKNKQINVYGPRTECLVLLDAWGQPMHYSANTNINGGKPYLQSAGPDGVWGSAGPDRLWGTSDDLPGDDVFSFER